MKEQIKMELPVPYVDGVGAHYKGGFAAVEVRNELMTEDRVPALTRLAMTHLGPCSPRIQVHLNGEQTELSIYQARCLADWLLGCVYANDITPGVLRGKVSG